MKGLVRLAVVGCAIGLVPASSVRAAPVVYDFTRTFGRIEATGTLTYTGSVPASLTVGDLNADATWTLTFSSPGRVDAFTLAESDSTWVTELLTGTSLAIIATADELVFDLTTPPETNGAVALMSDLDFSQFRFVQLNNPGLREDQVLIQGSDGPSVDHAALPYDVSLRFPAIAPPLPLDLFTLPLCRVIDTRNPAGPLGGPALAAGADRTFALAGACGIPLTAQAVSVSVVVMNPAAAGSVCLHPGGSAVSLLACTSYGAGQTRANNTVVQINAVGELAVFAEQAAGTVHFLLDVNGYFQ